MDADAKTAKWFTEGEITAKIAFEKQNNCITDTNENYLKNKWTGRKLNPRPRPCQGRDLPLIYRPNEHT
jgi:hypothetical protein